MSPSAAFGGISASESQTTQGLVSDHLPTHTTSTTTTTTMDRRQRDAIQASIVVKACFFFTLFIYSSTKCQLNKGETTTSQKSPNDVFIRVVWASGMVFFYLFSYFVH